MTHLYVSRPFVKTLISAVCVLLAGLCVAAHELVYATCSVHQLVLAGVEGVRCAGDFQLDYGILLTFKLYGFCCLAGRATQEHVAIAHVLEYYWTVILGMKSFFHFVFV